MKLTKKTSLESVASLTFPWRTIPRERPTLVAETQAGREVDPTGYFLCMCSVMLLSSGIGICVATIWSILYTMPYIYLTENTVLLGVNTFSLLGGILSIPCYWIGCTSHDTRKNYTFLPLLIVLLGFSLMMLATAIAMGLIYKSRINFDTKSGDPKLQTSLYKKQLNETLVSSMTIYWSNHNHHAAWDVIQSRIKCCGTVGFADWMHINKKLPLSCCLNSNCTNGTIYTEGCLDKMAADLKWEVSLISGLSLIVFAIQMLTFCMAGYMYIKGRLEGQNSVEFICNTATRRNQ